MAVSLKENMWQCPRRRTCDSVLEGEHVTVEIINFMGLKK